MPNIIQLTVEEPEKILNAGAYGAGALIRLQTAATEAGAYADVTGTGSTPTTVVVSGTRFYTGYDPNGISTSWYRTRFENAGATRLSDWSDPFQVAEEGSGLICSLWDVKQELGLPATDTTQDETLLEKIRQVGTEIQTMTGRRFIRDPAAGTQTFLFDVSYNTQVLHVPKGIAACTQVEVATTTQPETGGTYSIVPSSGWWLRPLEGERDDGWPALYVVLSDRGGYYFWAGFNTVRLTMALGFDSVPYDVQAVAQRAAIGAYLSKGTGTGLAAAAGPNGMMTILRFISPADQNTLMKYAVQRVGRKR